MKNFDLKSLDDWEHVMAPSILQCDCGASGSRKVRLSFNTTDQVTVWVSYNEDMTDRVLIARTSGLFDVAFTIDRTAYLEVDTNKGAIVFVAGHAPDHGVKKVADAVFTTLHPGARRSSDFDRMVMLMNHNQQRLAKQLEQERKLRERMERREDQREQGSEVVEPVDETQADGATDETQS